MEHFWHARRLRAEKVLGNCEVDDTCSSPAKCVHALRCSITIASPEDAHYDDDTFNDPPSPLPVPQENIAQEPHGSTRGCPGCQAISGQRFSLLASAVLVTLLG